MKCLLDININLAKKMKKLFKKLSIGILISILGLIIISFLLPISKSVANISQKPFENSHFIEINNIFLHYRYWQPDSSVATNEWVLLVHGLGGSTYAWENNTNFLQQHGMHVIAVDVPPFGYSDRNPDINHSPDVRADLLWEFASSIQPKVKWHIVGHSMGGGITEAMAIKKPEKIKSLNWVAPALFVHLKNKRSFGQIMMCFSPLERLMVVVGETFFITPKRISKMLHSAFGREATEKETNEYYKALSEDGTATAFVRAFSKAKVKTEMKLDELKIPALAIWGDKDTWVPYNNDESYLKNHPNISIKLIEGAGHCPMETHVEKFNQILLENIQKYSGKTINKN